MSDKIEQTYRIGNCMLEYLEKQIILDYHLRGEQGDLERDHPEMAELAKKYFGTELYYELAAQANGQPLPLDSPLFKNIIHMADDLNTKFHNDM